jgi:hypothetical protein
MSQCPCSGISLCINIYLWRKQEDGLPLFKKLVRETSFPTWNHLLTLESKPVRPCVVLFRYCISPSFGDAHAPVMPSSDMIRKINE